MRYIVVWGNQSADCSVEETEDHAISMIKNLLTDDIDFDTIDVYQVIGQMKPKIDLEIVK